MPDLSITSPTPHPITNPEVTKKQYSIDGNKRDVITEQQHALTTLQKLHDGVYPADIDKLKLAVNEVFNDTNEHNKAEVCVLLIQCRQDQQLPEAISSACADLLSSLSEQEKLHGLNLSGRDDLNYLDMSGLDFSHTNFSGSKMYKTILSHSVLNRADCTDAYMNQAILIGTKLEHAIMYNAYLGRADLKDAEFKIADLDHAALHGAKHMRVLDMFLHSLRRSDWEKRNLQIKNV